jgi:hypothetical protein
VAAFQGAHERDDRDQERQVGARCESAAWDLWRASLWGAFSPKGGLSCAFPLGLLTATSGFPTVTHPPPPVLLCGSLGRRHWSPRVPISNFGGASRTREARLIHACRAGFGRRR